MFLALFPLQLVIFPGEQVPLHIFEPRYKQLITECVQADLRFGIPAYVNGNISLFGTEVAVIDVLKSYDNGEMDIIVQGIRVFKILEFQKDVPGKLYSGGTVEYRDLYPDSDEETEKELREKFAELMRLAKHESTALERDNATLSFRIAVDAGLSLGQRVELLSLGTEYDRQKFLLAHIDRVITLIRERNSGTGRVSTNGRARMNGATHS